MKMTTAFILQARAGSSRLPNKMLLPFFEEKNIFEILLSKLQSEFDNPIILATSTDKRNDKLVEIAESYNILTFRGSENDVLSRFVNASKQYNFSRIIRICADNPFLDIAELKKIIDFVDNYKINYDYVSFRINDIPTIKTHYGFWTEYVTLESLERIVRFTDDPFYHEHVTNYIYTHPSLFNIGFIDVCNDLKDKDYIRMTLDTKEDFELLSSIYFELFDKYKGIFDIKNIIDYIDQNDSYKERMKEQIIKNTK